MITINQMPADIRKNLTKAGWDLHKHHISKTIGNRQVCIEFCLTDFCAGFYTKTAWGWELTVNKQQCENFPEAYCWATLWEAQAEKEYAPIMA